MTSRHVRSPVTYGPPAIGATAPKGIFGFPELGSCRRKWAYFGRRGIGVGAAACTCFTPDIGVRTWVSTAGVIHAPRAKGAGPKWGARDRPRRPNNTPMTTRTKINRTHA